MKEIGNLESIMNLIIYGGDAKSKAMFAIQNAKEFDFEGPQQNLTEASESLNKAHNSQTEMLTLEASGNEIDISLLMIHSQDHLMNAITFIDLAKEIVGVYKTLDQYKLANK